MSLSFPTMAAIRFGYGFRYGETPPQNRDELMAQLARGVAEAPRFVGPDLEARRVAIRELNDGLRQIRTGGADDMGERERRRILQRGAEVGFQRDANLRILQAVRSPNGFYERLATFWVNHFATSAAKSTAMRLIVPFYEAEAIRPHIGGKFATLLRAAEEHPAMLIYLDQVQSFGPASVGGTKRKKGLNENLGRELLELHTLGAGSGYTQADVRSAALVLTGLTADRDQTAADFLGQIAEPGYQTVLGGRYGGETRSVGDHRAMLDALAADPRTASHICRKLAAHFVSDQPNADLVQQMGEAWRQSDGDLSAVYRAMLDHPASLEGEGAKARQPFDYVVAGLRALDRPDGPADIAAFMQAGGEDEQALNAVLAERPGDAEASADAAKRRKAFRAARALGQGALRRMGQASWMPPSPAGFDDKFVTWITASQLSERLSWARRASAQFHADRDPRAFLKDVLGEAARDETIRVVAQAPNRISGLTLALASPEFNRR